MLVKNKGVVVKKNMGQLEIKGDGEFLDLPPYMRFYACIGLRTHEWQIFERIMAGEQGFYDIAPMTLVSALSKLESMGLIRFWHYIDVPNIFAYTDLALLVYEYAHIRDMRTEQEKLDDKVRGNTNF